MPRAILIILILSAAFKTAKAEYGGVYIKYELKLRSGEKKVGYGEYSGYKEEFDTLIKDNFMSLSFLIGNQDSVRFYTDMITYEYNWWFNENAMIQRGVANPIYVAANEIISVKVLDMYGFSYMMGFGTSHSLADSAWMKTLVVDTASASGYLCHWLIFVHEHNSEVDTILEKIKEIDEPLKALYRESRRIRKIYGFGYEYDRINEKIDALQNDDLDKKLSELIGKLNQYKVVVIQECSC